MLETGNIIRELRIKNGHTQNELADKLNISLSTMQKYESGNIVNLKLETLRELCNIFYVPPITFVFPNVEEHTKSDILRWGLRQFGGLNETGCCKVIEYTKDLLKIEEYRK